MNKKNLLFLMVIFLSGFLAYADEWNPDFDGPEPPPAANIEPYVAYMFIVGIVIFLVNNVQINKDIKKSN